MGLCEIPILLLKLREHPHILDGNDRLVGEGRDELYLIIGEGLRLHPFEGEDSDEGTLSEHRNSQQGSVASHALSFSHLIVGISQDVGNMNRPAFKRSAPGDRSSSGADRVSRPEISRFGGAS